MAAFFSSLVVATALRLESETLLLCRNAAQVLSKVHQVDLVDMIDHSLALRIGLFTKVSDLFAEISKEAFGFSALAIVALRGGACAPTSRPLQAIAGLVGALLVTRHKAGTCGALRVLRLALLQLCSSKELLKLLLLSARFENELNLLGFRFDYSSATLGTLFKLFSIHVLFGIACSA